MLALQRGGGRGLYGINGEVNGGGPLCGNVHIDHIYTYI
jgi:hypothetical protein